MTQEQSNEALLRELEIAGVSVSESVDRFLGNKAAYCKYLRRFLEDRCLSEIGMELQNKNTENAFRSAHTLKGIVGNLGLTPVMNALNPLVESLRAGNLEGGKEAFAGFRTAYLEIQKVISKYPA